MDIEGIVPLTKLRLTTASRHARLDETLADWLTQKLGRPVSKAKARKLVMAGMVLLNGQRVRTASQNLIAGTKLDLARAPRNYTWAKREQGDLLLAHGRDPYFDGWPDTLQLDYSNP